MYARLYKCVFLACVPTVMDAGDEQINTKSLSFHLHPNLPQHVCSVSQQAKTEEEEKKEEWEIMMWQ